MVSLVVWIGGFVILLAVVFFVIIYNGLILLRKNIDKAWANIDVLLKQRHDEIPKLVETVKQYRNYEKSTLTDLTQARTQAMNATTMRDKATAENALGMALGRFFAVAEAYPDLKANQSFLQLQNRVSELENMIADRREFYNDSVNLYNVRINQIPYNFIAGMLHYEERELFKVQSSEKQDVDMKKLFSA